MPQIFIFVLIISKLVRCLVIKSEERLIVTAQSHFVNGYQIIKNVIHIFFAVPFGISSFSFFMCPKIPVS